MNPLDTSLGMTLARQMLQAIAGTIIGAAIARGWITEDLGAQVVQVLVGLGLAGLTAAWAWAVKRRTNAAAVGEAPLPSLGLVSTASPTAEPGGPPAARATRGYRNRNPGNIDFNPANEWRGQVGKELGAGGRFCVFSSHEYGIRALAVLLLTYHDKHRLRTVRAIINRWAPPKENDTGAYVRAVARAVGVDPDVPVDLHRSAVLGPLVAAIIAHECAGLVYREDVMRAGLRMAGVG